MFNDIKNPRRDGDAIILAVLLEGESDYCEYVASETDHFGHGADLYKRAISGEFGEIIPRFTQDEIYQSKASEIRAERNRLLQASDWTQVPDAPTDKAAWAAYRQVLRDLPQHKNWPDVDWPQKPE